MISANLENNPVLLFDFQAGKEQAFNQIFNHFYPTLCLFATRILQEPLVAEDIVQESFVKVWQRRTEFKELIKLKSFIYVSVRNACFDQLAKNKVKLKYQSSIGSVEAIDEQNALKSMMQAEVVSRIFAEVDTLPEQCRKIIRMTFEEGKKAKDIADELGITVSTVNSQKMRGLTLLKGKLSDKDFLTAVILFLPGMWY